MTNFSPSSFETRQVKVPAEVTQNAQLAFKPRKSVLKQNPERRKGLLARALRGDKSPDSSLPTPSDST